MPAKMMMKDKGQEKKSGTSACSSCQEPSYDELVRKVARLEAELAGSRQFPGSADLDFVLDFFRDEIVFVDPEGLITHCNGSFLKSYHLEKEEVIGKSVGEFNPIMRSLDGGEMDFEKEVMEVRNGRLYPFLREFKVLRENQATLYYESTAQKVVVDGELKGFIIISRDITDRKNLEFATLENIKTTQALLNANADPAMLMDRNAIIIQANTAFSSAFDRSVEEMKGGNLREFLKEKNKRFLPPEYLDRGFKTKKQTQYEFEYRDKFYRTTIHPVLDENGSVYRVAFFTVDITDSKKFEQHLIKNKEALKAQVRERTTDLDNTNVALQVLLKKRERDKTDLEEKIIYNVKELILPILAKLKDSLQTKRNITLCDMMEANLEEIISPFSKQLSSQYFNFTPTELSIANMIKHGKTTQEIADTLHSSYNTIQFHRANIRKKLGINRKKSNLRTQLQLMDELS